LPARGAPFVGALAADIGFDREPPRDRVERFASRWRVRLEINLVNVASRVRPARDLDESRLARFWIGQVKVFEAREMRDWLFGLAVRRVDIGDRWRIGPAPWPIVSRIGPELPGVRSSSPSIEHRRRRLVGEDFRRRADMREKLLMHGPQMPGGATDPIGERRTIKRDPLPRVDLRLAIQRRVIGIFRDQHMRDGCFGRQASLDQPRRRAGLHDGAVASATGVFGTARHQHPEPRRDDVEPLGEILADPMQQPFAARASFVLDVDDNFDARQMRWQRAAVRAPTLPG
jgi:hypothetical protein